MMKQWWARLVLGSTSVNAPADSDDRPDAEFEARWRNQLKARLLLVLGALMLWVVGIEARLVFLQVVSHQQWVAAALKQSEKQYPIRPPAARGEVTDRNGKYLAYSAEGYSLVANPSQVLDVEREVEAICAALEDCTADLRADLRDKLGRRAASVVLRGPNEVSPSAADGIGRLIASRQEAKRPAVVTLAKNDHGATLVRANPSQVQDVAREVEEICAALGDCLPETRAEFGEKLVRKAAHIVLRDARSLSPAAAARLERLIAARVEAAKREKDRTKKRPVVISVTTESLRFYPQGPLASHVVGFTTKDLKGGGGIERRFNKDLAGVPGEAVVEVDRDGVEIQRRVVREPSPGATVELTIDASLQHICERELAAGVAEFQAAGGVIVMQDPFTGEILAQCSFPTYNPNAFWEADAETMRDRAVTDTYEPGSTLKLVTAAAAINEGVWKTTELIDTNPGVIVIPGRAPITEALRHNYGVVSFETALIKSSNVGAIKIAQRIGPELLSQYLWRMGFGQALGPDFIGQSRGRVPSSGRMSASTLASLSMGYEIGVTPLQMVTAASIVANGGQLIEPRVVNAWIRNGRRQDVEPRVLKRAISPETAATLTAILERVVEPGGTATLAALQRYRVAGKTGTAEKVVNGRYSSTDHVVSFVGFLPSHQPRLTILVAMDAPRKGRIFGGTVAAPIFRRVAEAAMVYLGVTPSINPLPPVVVPTDRRALDVPSPRSASIIPTLTRVDTRAIMPDVRGMSLRDALRVTQALGLSTVTTEGSGVVVEQSPAPGAFVEPHVAGALQLRRLPAAGRNDR